MKKSKLAITVAVSGILLAGACSPQQPQWDADNERYCVDNDGDLHPMSYCDNGGGHGMFLMYGSNYRSHYPKKYKSYAGKMRSSSYVKSSSSGVVRGSGGTTGRSFGGSFGG